MLREFIGDRKTGPVLRSRKGTPSPTRTSGTGSEAAAEEAGDPNAGLHAFRHGAVTMHRKAGTPENLLRMWLGHSTLGNVTDR